MSYANSLKQFSGSAAALPKTQINSAHVKGEPGTGFEEYGNMGDFNCGNCHFFDDGCGQPDMLKRSKRPRTPQGLVEVGSEDCCEYVDRVGGEWRRMINGKQEK